MQEPVDLVFVRGVQERVIAREACKLIFALLCKAQHSGPEGDAAQVCGRVGNQGLGRSVIAPAENLSESIVHEIHTLFTDGHLLGSVLAGLAFVLAEPDMGGAVCQEQVLAS